MILHRLLSAITRQERSKLNENFDRIERSYKGVIDTSSEAKDNSITALKVANGIDGKATEALEKSEDAVNTSEKSDEIANIAKTTADATAQQLENVILESGTSDAETIASRTNEITGETYSTLYNRLDNDYKKLVEVSNDITSYGYNLINSGLDLTGETDVSEALQALIRTHKHVIVPKGARLGIANTIVVTNGASLTGSVENIREQGVLNPMLVWIGDVSPRKAMIQVGSNDVGAEPSLDGSNAHVRNLFLECNDSVGFGIYGTYLTNETTIENVVIHNPLEHGLYIARAWYARINRIVVMDSRNAGITLGIPLEYSDGDTVTWTTPNAIEMNNCEITDLRSTRAGRMFSENPDTYTPLNVDIRSKGYGVGIGWGNAMFVTNITSESSGGVGLYVQSHSQPMKKIENVYLERNCLNSGLDPAGEMTQILIENKSATGGPIELRDVFCAYGYGGIYHTGVLGRKVWLRNVHQPRFLKSLDGLTPLQLYGEVLKDNVYECGLYNAYEPVAQDVNVIQSVNTRGSFTIPVVEYEGFKLIYAKLTDATQAQAQGSLTLNYSDGATASRSYPTLTTSYTLVTVGTRNLISLTRGGTAGTADSNVVIKVVNTPYTNI